LFETTCNRILRLMDRSVLPLPVRRALRACISGILEPREALPHSFGWERLSGEVWSGALHGWKDPVVAARQHSAFVPLLRDMREGRAREDFLALAKAVQLTGHPDPLVIEVGCGSGWKVMSYISCKSELSPHRNGVRSLRCSSTRGLSGSKLKGGLTPCAREYHQASN